MTQNDQASKCHWYEFHYSVPTDTQVCTNYREGFAEPFLAVFLSMLTIIDTV